VDVVRKCKRAWRRLGVPREVADEMAAELEADLNAAEEAGVSPDRYVGLDPVSFAIKWAEARAVTKPRMRLVGTTAAALIGVVPGVGLALFGAYGLSSQAIGDMFGAPVRVGENTYQNFFEAPLWLILGFYGVGAIFAYAGGVASVSAFLTWRFDPARARTQRLLVATLPLGMCAAIAATVLFAATQEFGTTASVVFADVFVAGMVFALFVLGVRVSAVRRERRGSLPDDYALAATPRPSPR
jgi:hypothetical protein